MMKTRWGRDGAGGDDGNAFSRFTAKRLCLPPATERRPEAVPVRRRRSPTGIDSRARPKGGPEGRARQATREATDIDGKARGLSSSKQVAKSVNRHSRQRSHIRPGKTEEAAKKPPFPQRERRRGTQASAEAGGGMARSAMRYCGKAGLIMLRQPRPRLTGKFTPTSTCRRSRTRRYWLRRLSRSICSSQPSRGRASEGVLAL